MKKFIFGFLLGGIAAGVPAYFITKKLVEDRCQAEVNELKDYYKNKYEKPCEVEVAEISPSEEEAIKKHVNKVPDKPVPPSYKQIADKYKSEDKNNTDSDAPDEYYDEEDMADADAEYPPEDRADVEIISHEEYDEINHEFEHSCLIYYTNDMQLATEEGQIIDNEKYLIEDALDVDGWRNNDEMVDNIYVRNNKISEMFEIAKCIGAYGDLN